MMATKMNPRVICLKQYKMIKRFLTEFIYKTLKKRLMYFYHLISS